MSENTSVATPNRTRNVSASRRARNRSTMSLFPVRRSTTSCERSAACRVETSRPQIPRDAVLSERAQHVRRGVTGAPFASPRMSYGYENATRKHVVTAGRTVTID